MEFVRDCRKDFLYYAPRALKIKAKDGSIIPLRLNRAQEFLHRKIHDQRCQTGKVRVIGLKGRQQGFSTYTEARFYWLTSLHEGKRAFILTHLAEATANIFGMARRYHEHCPEILKPATSAANANQLAFGRLDSEFSVATAGSAGTGRSATAQYFHGCLAAGTPVVDGVTGRLRPIESFEPGDMVRTHTGALAPITLRSTQTKHCVELVIRGLRDFPLRCTHEHRFYTTRGWVTGGELRVGDCIGYPVADLGTTPMRLPFAIPLAVRAQSGGAEHRPPECVMADEALGLLIGLYLAEGCIKRQWKTGVPSSVTFAMHEAEVGRNAAWVEALEPLFASLSVRSRDDSKTVTIEAYGKALATRVLEWCGDKDNKHLPAWWREAPREFAQGMVRGYLCGDGHFSATRDRRISATSIRSAITIGMRDAIAALGFGWASVEHKTAGIRHGRDEKEAWVLRLCGPGVDRLSALCGKPSVPRQRDGSYPGAVVRDGYAWAPIVEIADDGPREVYEFEVGHADHSYCILHGATHNSEVAFWPNAADHMAGIGQIIANAPGTEIILESTANGVGNLFHGMWEDAIRGKGEYIPVFVPWFWQDEYALTAPDGWAPLPEDTEYGKAYGLTAEQIYWRRLKIDTDFRGDVALFDQEYPATPALAFRRVAGTPLITADLVVRARKAEGVEARGNKIMGVDVAEYGDDDSAIALRQGRVVPSVKRKHGLGPMEVAGWVALEADEWKPDAINVDCTGIGSGVADRLLERGYPVNRIHFGSRAVNQEQYARRKDEMWGEMRDWFGDPPNQIPDDDVLQTDLTAVQYSYDSSRRLVIESKENMRKNGYKSPDSGDALALTFAVHMHYEEPEKDRYRRTYRPKGKGWAA